MTEEEALAFVAGDMNGVTETAKRAARHLPLVRDTNAIIRSAADELIDMDSSPASFAALKADCEPAQ